MNRAGNSGVRWGPGHLGTSPWVWRAELSVGQRPAGSGRRPVPCPQAASAWGTPNSVTASLRKSGPPRGFPWSRGDAEPRSHSETPRRRAAGSRWPRPAPALVSGHTPMSPVCRRSLQFRRDRWSLVFSSSSALHVSPVPLGKAIAQRDIGATPDASPSPSPCRHPSSGDRTASPTGNS